MDPQANACSGMGIDKTEVFSTVYNVLLGEEEINDAVRKTELDYLDVLPSNTDLIGAEIELVDKKERELQLRYAIAEVSDQYDYIIIDCPHLSVY